MEYSEAREIVKAKSIPALNLDYEELENRVQATLCSIQNELDMGTIGADLCSALFELERLTHLGVSKYTN